MENVELEQQEELVQYFVVNKDLEMSPGKIAAQIARMSRNIALVYESFPKLIEMIWYKEWLNSPNNTIIVLKGSEKELLKLIDAGFLFVRDNGLTEIPADSLTVVGLNPMPKSRAQTFVKRLRLL